MKNLNSRIILGNVQPDLDQIIFVLSSFLVDGHIQGLLVILIQAVRGSLSDLFHGTIPTVLST